MTTGLMGLEPTTSAVTVRCYQPAELQPQEPLPRIELSSDVYKTPASPQCFRGGVPDVGGFPPIR